MRHTKQIVCNSLGHTAYQVLRRNRSALVAGTAERGIYLQPGDDLVCYLSLEEFQGPLTGNLTPADVHLTDVQPGTSVSIRESSLIFSEAGIEVAIDQAKVWQPPPPLDTRFQGTQLGRVYRQVGELAGEHPFFPLFEIVISRSSSARPDFPGAESWLKTLDSSVSGPAGSVNAGELIRLLGAGPGLTPLGDDLLLGYLLALVRRGGEQESARPLADFRDRLLGAARQQTTRLSYSLLACAGEGSADQRLLRVLDGLLSGRDLPDRDLAALLAWGSSSGVAVLAGMLLALQDRGQ